MHFTGSSIFNGIDNEFGWAMVYAVLLRKMDQHILILTTNINHRGRKVTTNKKCNYITWFRAISQFFCARKQISITFPWCPLLSIRPPSYPPRRWWCSSRSWTRGAQWSGRHGTGRCGPAADPAPCPTGWGFRTRRQQQPCGHPTPGTSAPRQGL